MHDILYKTWTDKGLVHIAKVRIFNNMLYVYAIRTLDKAKHIRKGQTYRTYPLVRDVTQGL
jgi:hypothetical protein